MGYEHHDVMRDKKCSFNAKRLGSYKYNPLKFITRAMARTGREDPVYCVAGNRYQIYKTITQTHAREVENNNTCHRATQPSIEAQTQHMSSSYAT